MIIWDDGFLTELDDNRILVIEGRLSSGKSLLACELVERYMRKGYKLLSQTACVWNNSFDEVTSDASGRLRTVIWMDEGGLQYRTAKAAQGLSSFAAKLDSYIIFSGKKVPHADLCTLTCCVWFDFFKWFLIPLKIWRYDAINGHKTYSGYFLQTGWWEYWGIYSTLDPGDTAEGVHGFIKEKTKEYFSIYNRQYTLHDVETGGGNDVDEEFANEFASSVRTFEESAKAVHRSQKRWGR